MPRLVFEHLLSRGVADLPFSEGAKINRGRSDSSEWVEGVENTVYLNLRVARLDFFFHCPAQEGYEPKEGPQQW